MQLTSFTDYALRALMFMATLPERQLTSISEVANIYGVSRNHMVKIIHQLSRTGYVDAVRGKNGGIRLGKPSSQIIVGHVIRQMEPLQIVDCSECKIMPSCRLKKALNEAVKCFIKELDNYTLADLANTNQPLNKLLLAERAEISN